MSARRLTRRRLLVSAGAGVVGISVVTTIGGCSESPGKEPAAGGSASPTSASRSASPSVSAGPALPGNWRRVDLSFVSAYILIRGNEAAVVDVGTPGSDDAIEAALTAAGSRWDAVRHVIVTHQHQDHAGALADVAPKATAATLYSGAADAAAISQRAPVKSVDDGAEIFGLRIVGTPGHTAGHVSVFDPSTGVLVAGDALRTTQGLLGPDARNSSDMKQAAASVRKLATLAVKVILPGHGAPLTTGAAEALAALAAAQPAG